MIPTILSPGYFLHYSKEPGEYRHLFCGPHQVPGAECPNCAKPLLRFFSFNTADPRLQALQAIAPQLHLLNCWTCNLVQHPFYYQCLPDGSVRLLQYGIGGTVTDFPYPNYPRHFPGRFASLTPLTPDEQYIIELLNNNDVNYYGNPEMAALAIPTHQFGGEPWFVQSWDCCLQSCPVCHGSMRFFASVCDLCMLPQGFVDDRYVQMIFTLCPVCKVIGSVVHCD